MLKYIALVLTSILFIGLSVDAEAQTRVRGYTRKDGTYVQPHMRSNPDNTRHNNWSTRGNTNPYTGKVGTQDPNRPSSSTFGGYR